MKIIQHGHEVFVFLRRTVAFGFGFQHFEQLNGVARVGLIDLARAGDRTGYVTELHQCLRTQAAQEVEEGGFRNFGRVRHAQHSAPHLFLASGRCPPMRQALARAATHSKSRDGYNTDYVANRLAEDLRGTTIYTDAPDYDARWVGKWFSAIGQPLSFHFEHSAELLLSVVCSPSDFVWQAMVEIDKLKREVAAVSSGK